MSGTNDGHHDDERADLTGAPLDLMLADAAHAGWRRFVPDSSTLRFAGGLAARPGTVVSRGRGLVAELGRVVAGTSTTEPDRRDKRFADEAWTGNPLLHRVMQGYLATARTAEALVADAGLPEHDALRVAATVSNAADALAPSNNPLFNPRALRAVVDTGGATCCRVCRTSSATSPLPRGCRGWWSRTRSRSA